MSGRSEELKVFVRVRPPIFKEVKLDTAVIIGGTQGITLNTENKEVRCSYDYVFNEVSEQHEVFEKVQPLLVDVLSGVNACIFAYGQTSAGKSYTMICPNGGQDILSCPKEEWGILPRASEFLLGYLNEKAVEGLLTYEVKASFLQIYNENLYDLLRDSGPRIEDKLILQDLDRDELKIREIPVKFKNRNSSGRSANAMEVFVHGLSEYRVQTSEDILRILAVGTANRMTRSTDFNTTSSRSHAVLQLTFEIESQLPSGQTVINRSKLNLIDLAGSEKIPMTDSQNTGKHLKELTSINKSLSTLGNVIAALASGNRSHIPYRDSKLTRILQDSLSGNTRTILVACVAPTVLHASESLSTLQFADRAKSVMLTVKANQLVDDKFQLIKANNEIARLKTLLSRALKQLEQKSVTSVSSSGDSDYQTTGELSSDQLNKLRQDNDELRKENKALRGMLKGAAGSGGGGGTMAKSASLDASALLLPGIASGNLAAVHSRGEDQKDAAKKKKKTMRRTMDAAEKHGFASPVAAVVVAEGMQYQNNRSNAGNKPPQQQQQQQRQTERRSQSVPRLPHDPTRARPDDDDDDNGSSSYSPNPIKTDGISAAKPKKERRKEVHENAAMHSSLYKAINERQIEELNHMLALANRKVQMQLDGDNRGLEALLGAANGGRSPKAPVFDSGSGYQNNGAQQQRLQQDARVGNSALPYIPPTGGRGAVSSDYVVTPQQKPSNVEMQLSGRRTDSTAALTSAPLPQQQQPSVDPIGGDAAQYQQFLLWQQQQKQQVEQHQRQQQQLQKQQQQTTTKNFPSTISSQQQPETVHSAVIGGTVPDSSRSGMISDRTAAAATVGRNTLMTPTNRIVMRVKTAEIQPQQPQPLPQPGDDAGGGGRLNVRNAGGAWAASPVPTTNVSASSAFLAMASMSHQQQQGAVGGGLAASAQQQTPVRGDGAAANLTFSKDDIGMPIQMFSFRMNAWDRIELLDYEPNKSLHKVRHSDGTVQWLDLTKKPTRSADS